MNGQPDRPEADAADDDVSAAEEQATEEAGAAATASDPDSVQAELQAKIDENWEKYLRAAAELENVRKRATRDVENAHKFALERFASELLAVRDSLEMGLAAAEDADVDTLLQGKEATLKQLHRAGFRIVVAHGHGPSTGFFNKHRAEWKDKFGLDTFVCWGGEYECCGSGGGG